MNKTHRWGIVWGVVVIIIILGVFVGIFNTSNDLENNDNAPIKIGFIGPLTGDAATYGESISNAVRIAVDEVNAAGGVDGREVEIIFEDGKCTPKDALNAARKLIDFDRVKIIIGGACSGEALAIVPVAEEAGVLVFSPSATSPDLSGISPLFFRAAPSDSITGKELAELVIRDGYESAAIISEKTDYAQGIGGVFIDEFTALGGEIVSSEDFAPTTADFRSIVTKIGSQTPAAIVVNPQTSRAGGLIVKQIREQGIDVPLYAPNVLADSKTVEIAGEFANGIKIIDSPGLDQDNATSSKFLADYSARYGDLSGVEFYAAAAYDVVQILADAILENGVDVESIAGYIESLDSYNGLIGTYEFNDSHDLDGVPFIIKEIVDGNVVESVN